MFLNRLNNGVGMFVVHDGPPKCKLPLQDWMGPKANLILEIDEFAMAN